jgi:hypothetical protein
MERRMSEINLKSTKLFDELSKEELEVLLDESNAKKVQEFCKTLIASKSENSESLPTELKVGDRVYEILGFHKKGEESIVGHEMVKRVAEMKANLGEDDGQYLLDHQQDIPESLRGKIYFAFTDFCVFWLDGCWVRHWNLLGDFYWDGNFRVLRRKK